MLTLLYTSLQSHTNNNEIGFLLSIILFIVLTLLFFFFGIASLSSSEIQLEVSLSEQNKNVSK
ncbi:MAG: hypothetical protein KatS3mg089_0536 [Patescibacteria group bacterium]|nr:MAG: hypothetical protein KatS3mg089_0536 [Patescibacteria group bacterium]